MGLLFFVPANAIHRIVEKYISPDLRAICFCDWQSIAITMPLGNAIPDRMRYGAALPPVEKQTHEKIEKWEIEELEN